MSLYWNGPPYSPDLNPIEHVWKHLKEELQKLYPWISNVPGCPETVKMKMAEILPQVWDSIDKEFLKNLIESMPHQIEAVIQAGGWYTGY